MIRQLAERADRWRQRVNLDRERLTTRGSAGTTLAVGSMFVAGFVLGRWRTGDVRPRAITDARAKISSTATRVRDDAGSVISEQIETVRTEAGSAEETTGESQSAEDATSEAERERKREAAAALSPPTVRGMPMLGMGTYDNADYDECLANAREAIQIGYRHVDAIERREAYYSESAVGDAVDQAHLPREDLFVATKVHPADLDYDHVTTSLDESLDRLDLDYVDLLYVHWPTDEYDPEETLAAFAELREEGLIERIGVSNFTVDLLEEAMEASEAPIFANQVEMHPLLPQTELREFCDRDDVDVELVAYSPIARGDVEDVPELQAVAEKHDATPEQVSLAWLREKGVTAIPRATTEDHLLENWLSLDLELDPEDVKRLDSIEQRRRLVDPDHAPWNQ